MASSRDDCRSSSESDGDTEPAKFFRRRLSTSCSMNTTKCTKEGCLMKETHSFQRWSRRYFKLRPRKLCYAKEVKFVVYNEIDLIDTTVAECSVENVNHSFQVITPFRNLVLCADSRKEMEEWIPAIRSATSEAQTPSQHDPGSELVLAAAVEHHSWCSFPHIRPLYCNVCREALSSVTRSGVTLNGLACEVCKLKVHKRCAAKVQDSCKWTTLASIGDEMIEEEDGTITMPHQWIEGNLPVNAKCVECEKTCGSIRRLKDFWCLWCHCTVHAACRTNLPKACTLGPCRVSVLPPTTITSLDSNGFWRAMKPPGTSPLLVFLNSRSGDNQGVKMLWKFKQLLNPAQVFDLINGGPKMGLRLFQNFESFRVLICGGDGSIGWVLNEIDKLGLHKQCQIGVLPLGTGNDLSRVLGWGGNFDDETQLSSVLNRLEHAQIKMLDRWSIYSYESSLVNSRRLSAHGDQLSAYEDLANYLSRILHSDSYNVVISSAANLCEKITELTDKMASMREDEDDSISDKCLVLKEKMKALMMTLNEESQAASEQIISSSNSQSENHKNKPFASSAQNQPQDHDNPGEEPVLGTIVGSPLSTIEPVPVSNVKPHRYRRKGRHRIFDGIEVSETIFQQYVFRQREQLMSRANSLKKAIRQIIEHTERAVDEQNAQTLQFELENAEAQMSSSHTCKNSLSLKPSRPEPLSLPLIIEPDDSSTDAVAVSPPLLISTLTPPSSLIIPTITLINPSKDEENNDGLISPSDIGIPMFLGPYSSTDRQTTSLLTVPSYSPFMYSSSDGESSSCSTPGVSTPGMFSNEHINQVPLTPVGCQSPSFDRGFLSPSPTPSSRSLKLIGKDASTRKISRLSTLSAFSSLSMFSSPRRERSPTKEGASSFPLLNLPLIQGLSSGHSHLIGSSSSKGGSFIGKVLLANADALCAAATPLFEKEEINLDGYDERCVMNNYFGIGLDAKIALDFHQKREEHPEKCRSRTKNMMWFGVLGGKEIVAKTYKNLEQRVKLECDGQPIPLPNLQGIVILNIPSYMGGTNFWGGTKEDDTFIAPSFDDNILEVVAVFGCMQLGISRVINLQRHRIAQCRVVKITVLGDEGVPVQVDGEAWVQPPGFIYVIHKNRAQMLTRDKVFEEALKTWLEKQKLEKPVSLRNSDILSSNENILLHGFVEASESLIRSVKLASICSSNVEQDLLHLATQASCFLDRLFPEGRLSRSDSSEEADINKPVARIQVSDLVSSVHTLYKETGAFLSDRVNVSDLRPDITDAMVAGMSSMDVAMIKVYEIGGLPHLQAVESEASNRHKFISKEKNRSRWGFIRGTKKERFKDNCGSSSEVLKWSTDEVSQWLSILDLDEHKNAFATHDIRGRELLSLSRTDLKELGVTKVGHVKRIRQAIKDLKKSTAADLEKHVLPV